MTDSPAPADEGEDATGTEPSGQLTEIIASALGPAAAVARAQWPDDTEEIQAITDAMVRLLTGVPLRSDGQLTIKSLAEEAGLKRNKLTHKYTGLKDLFYALVRAQNIRPKDAADAPQHSEALGELATLIEQFNAPKIGEPSGSPADEVMQHPLVRLADTYRKIVIDRVARTAPPTQAARAADQSHGTDEGAEQTSGAEPTAGGDKP